MITINNKIPLGSFVKYRTDEDNNTFMVTGLEVYPDGSFVYKISKENNIHWAQEIEIEIKKGVKEWQD